MKNVKNAKNTRGFTTNVTSKAANAVEAPNMKVRAESKLGV